MRSNIYVIKDNYAQMIIESKKYGIKRVKIDIEDIEKCKKYQWHYANSKDVPYIVTRINGKYIRLHRYIYENVDDGLVVDHMNRITNVNEELVKTNRELCSSMNIKLGIIEDKVDKIANELDT